MVGRLGEAVLVGAAGAPLARPLVPMQLMLMSAATQMPINDLSASDLSASDPSASDLSAKARTKVRIYRRSGGLGPNAVRQCSARYVQEVRPSGVVIVPRMSCWWEQR